MAEPARLADHADLDLCHPSVESQDAGDTEIEAIKQLKARYMACLNEKDWVGLVGVLARDASVSYEDGLTNHRGRNAIIGYLRDSLGLLNAVHTATNGLITLCDATSAEGTWDLHYDWHDPWDNTHLQGSAVYIDRYVKVDGVWLIKFTGFTSSAM